MKDSDIGELYVEINIDPTIISDLERMQQRLIILTHNDESLMSKIVEHSLLLEKTPDHYLRRHRKNENDDEKGQLLTLVYELGLIITGKDKRITDTLKHLSDETTLFYKKLIREKINSRKN